MQKTLLIIFFLFSSIWSYSQNVMISGKVEIDNVDEPVDLTSIIVINQNSNSKVKTNSNGIFSIKVQYGDELEFVSAFTENRSIKITSSIISKGFINVHLDLEVIELSEANFAPLKKNLKNNLDYKKEDEIDRLYANLNLGIDPKLRFRKIDPTYTSQVGGGYGPISGLIGLINGSTKKAKKTHQYFKDVEKLDRVKNYFTNSYFVERLNIPEYKVDEFITYCYSKTEIKKLIDNNRYQELLEHFVKEAPEYVKLLNP